MHDHTSFQLLDASTIDDKEYELGAVVPKRIRDTALSFYMDVLKSGKRIPQPLQDYINRGLQRVVDGEEPPFPVTKADKLNKVVVASSVEALMDMFGAPKATIIKAVAAENKVSTKTVGNICKQNTPTPPEYVIYYIIEALEEIDNHNNSSSI